MSIYEYSTDKQNKICYIFKGGNFLGSVWIDATGAWNPNYLEGVTYLPINSALKLLAYPSAEGFVIE